MKNNKKIFLIVLFSLFFSSSIFSATKNIQSIFNDGVQAHEEQNLYLACQYFLEVVNENIKPNYVDFNKIKNGIRDRVGKYLYHETECKPMVLIVMQEV